MFRNGPLGLSLLYSEIYVNLGIQYHMITYNFIENVILIDLRIFI